MKPRNDLIKTLSFSSLRVRLALLIIMAMLPVLALTFSTYLEERDLVFSHVSEDMQRIARFAAGTQEQLIEGTRQLLFALASDPQAKAFQGELCGIRLSQILEEDPRYSNLGVIAPNGQLVCSARDDEGRTDFSNEAWFQRTLNTLDFTMTALEAAPSTGKPALIISTPVLGTANRPLAVIYAAVDLDHLKRLTFLVPLPKEAEFFMTTEKGTILAYLPDPEKWVGKTMPDLPVLEAIAVKPDRIAQLVGLDGRERLYAFTPLCSSVDTGLYVSIGFPTAIIYSEAGKALLHHFMGLGLVVLLALSAVWFGSDIFLIRRVNALDHAVQRLSSGDMKARSGLPRGSGELDRLALAFDNMAEALEQHAFQLHAAEAKYRTLVEQVPVITYTAKLDATRTTLYISPQVEALLGFSPNEWIADPELWTRQIHPEDLPGVQAALDESRSNRISFRSPYRIYTRDGRLLWFHDDAVAVRDDAGELQYLHGIMQDTTQQRAAEEKLIEHQRQLRSLAAELSLAEERERRRIATELHDRIGQTLAISKIKLGVLGQSAPKECAAPLDEVRKMIESAIQETRSLIFRISSPILYELGLESALEWLAEQFQKDHGILSRFEDDGQIKPLDGDVRILLFQAASELLVNVAKHARAHHVRVGARREGDRIRVCVDDDGKGFDRNEIGSRWERMEGFGLFSIRERLDHIGGRLEIQSEPGRGTHICLIAPLQRPKDASAA